MYIYVYICICICIYIYIEREREQDVVVLCCKSLHAGSMLLRILGNTHTSSVDDLWYLTESEAAALYSIRLSKYGPHELTYESPPFF